MELSIAQFVGPVPERERDVSVRECVCVCVCVCCVVCCREVVPSLILVRRENHPRRMKKNRHAQRPRRRRQGGLDYKVAAWLAVTAGGSSKQGASPRSVSLSSDGKPSSMCFSVYLLVIIQVAVLHGHRALMIHSDLNE